jgi:hypothetical protein
VLQCLCEFMGGKVDYQKKNEWDRMIPLKKEDQLPMLPDNQTISRNGHYSWEV